MSTKISALTALDHTAIASNDLFAVVDVSATTTKSITLAELNQSAAMANATALTQQGSLVIGKINDCDTTSVWTSGSIATLPDPTGVNSGRALVIRDSANTFDTHNLTVARFGSEKIAGIAASYVMNARGAVVAFISNGTDWLLPTSGQTHTITNKSGTYTFVLADAGQTYTNSGATNTLTIDSNANVAYPFTPDSAITIVNKAASALTIAVTGSATINGANANRTVTAASTGVYPTVSIFPTAADTWILVGNYT